MLLEKSSSLLPSTAGWWRSTRPADGESRGRQVSFISIDDGKFVSEPSVPLSVTFASFAINLLALALPLSIMQVYDRIIPNHSLATLTYLFLGLTLAIVIDYVLKTSRSALLSWHATRFVEKVENEGVSRFLRAPNGAFERNPAAVNLNRYAAAAALAEYHSGQAKLVTIDLPFVGIALIVMAIVGSTMVLVPAVLFFIFAALAIGRAREFREILDSRTAQDNRKYDFIAEVLAGIHTVKGMAMEPQMQRRFERLQQAVAETTMASILTGQASQTSALLYGSISQLIVVAIGGTQVINDHLTMGALACCTMLSGQILQPLLRAISLWTEKESVNHRRAEVRLLLDLPPVEPLPAELPGIVGNIQFENVTFKYESADQLHSRGGRSVDQGWNDGWHQRPGRFRPDHSVEAHSGRHQTDHGSRHSWWFFFRRPKLPGRSTPYRLCRSRTGDIFRHHHGKSDRIQSREARFCA